MPVIVDNSATLVVLGDAAGSTADRVTSILRLIPTLSLEAGTTVGGSGATARVLDHSVWHLVYEDHGTGSDASGFASLYGLLQALEGKGQAVAMLQQERYEVRIDWRGESDSDRGGFILDPVLAARVARLGIPVYGTTVWHGTRSGAVRAGAGRGGSDPAART